jgi:hypothetical protein
MPQKPNNYPPRKRQKGQAPCNRKSRRAAGIAGTSAGAWNAAGIWFAPAGRSIHIKNLKGSIIMEEKKRKFNFHAEIDTAAERLNVSIDKGNPTVGDLLVCCLGITKYVAVTIADNNKKAKQKVLRDIAAMVSAMADEALDKEET